MRLASIVYILPFIENPLLVQYVLAITVLNVKSSNSQLGLTVVQNSKVTRYY